MKKVIALAIFYSTSVTLVACDNPFDSDGSDKVALRFASISSTSSARASGFSLNAMADELTVTGSDGAVLRIDDIQLLIADVELRRANAGTCADADAETDCDEDFHLAPMVVDLPLSGGSVTLATDQLPQGSYSAVEFSVDDLRINGEQDASAIMQAKQAALAKIRLTYPAFPDGAVSMAVHGFYTAPGGTAQEFTVWVDQEIDIAMALNPPAEVPGTGTITVQVDPAKWFLSNGRVLNLAAFNGRRIDGLAMAFAFLGAHHSDD